VEHVGVTGKSSALPQAIQPSGGTVSETCCVGQRISHWRRFAHKGSPISPTMEAQPMRYGFKCGFRHLHRYIAKRIEIEAARWPAKITQCLHERQKTKSPLR
jgi:hypothetical protein